MQEDINLKAALPETQDPDPPTLVPQARRTTEAPAPAVTGTAPAPAPAPVQAPAPAPVPVPVQVPAPGKSGGRLHILDLCRFSAALSVVLYHYTARGRGWHGSEETLFPVLRRFSEYGWTGVELFFLISGFVICMSSWGRRVGSFFASRVSRLFPAYLIAVLLTASGLTNWPTHHPTSGKDAILVNLTMLESSLNVHAVDSVYWTLNVELHFYLLFALVVWRGLTYQRAVGFCVVWTTAAVFVPSFAPDFDNVILNSQYSAYFVAGIAFYLIHRFGQNLLLWCIVAVSYALATHEIQFDVATQTAGTTNHLSLTVVDGLLAAFFVLMGLIATGRLSWIRGRWTVVLGAVTYPLYLIHQEIGYALIHRYDDRMNRYVLLVGLILAMTAVAWLIHRFVERPLGPRLRRALTNSLRTPSEL